MPIDTEVKSVLDSIKTSVGEYGSGLADLRERTAKMQTQVDAIDASTRERIGGGGGDPDPLRKALESSDELKRLIEVGKGSAIISVKNLSAIHQKTLISTGAVGSGTVGVLMPSQVGGIVPGAERRLFMRDLLSRGRTTTQGAVYFLQESGFTNASSPQTEGSDKGESAITFEAISRPVITLAHWLPATVQVIQDFDGLLDYVRRKLLFGLRYKEDQQVLSGSGTGLNLSGLITEASGYDTGLNVSGDTRADKLRHALEQVETIDEAPVGFFVLHPHDWAAIELIKDAALNVGNYVVGAPREATTPRLWGRPVVVTTAITSGTFLAGSSESAEIIDRMDATIEISNSHSDFFIKNKVAIRCESRLTLCIYRPEAFVYGSF